MYVQESEEFERLTGPLRAELLAYCYRMLGSVQDAEDQVQETLLRAWRGYGGFEGRSSVRTWLYRIATNACLRALETRGRRPLPSGLGGPAEDPDAPLAAARPEVPWLQPIPDTRFGSAPADPAAVVVSRTSMRLALIAALQYLPPRQRAVLILRDVLGWRAAEVAGLLGTSVPAVNSALQRAREHLEAARPAEDEIGEPDSPAERDLVGRYAAPAGRVPDGADRRQRAARVRGLPARSGRRVPCARHPGAYAQWVGAGQDRLVQRPAAVRDVRAAGNHAPFGINEKGAAGDGPCGGPGVRSMGVDTIDEFRIDIPQAELDDLRDRLARTRWPDQLPDVGWDYGIALDDVRELAEYWRTTYDWRVFEDRLNGFGQFTTEIDGQAVHFLHVRSAAPGALPLIMTHGWPGSVVEFMEVIGPLTDPGAHGGDPGDAFDLVVPSIPGFGFSGPTRERGWNVQRVARAWDELMGRLGYERYGAQGGDWGSSISRELGVLAPERVIGVHLNMLTPYVLDESVDLSDSDKERVERLRRFRRTGSGYGAIQATRPQTVGYGLTDSPAGQLAWIAEKFGEWTDGGLGAVDRDQMLTNISVYWLTRTAGSSARLYYEAARSGALGPPTVSTAPTGVAVFPEEIAAAVRPIAEQSNHIVHWSEFDRGGHFAAMEEPDLLIGDVREFFRLFRPAS
jgi:epoxide hydrolase